ncbi:hypothetical protein KC19_10G101500 [Ceratodon purpureus]|uniref:Uncharacterized protein n=1 Tax=Ceratodon purpureus TaxID=3225 RepID=A0A8T0GK61_CERPU|nr:hypothetical protein KC19_10G101500 [Ceratodon purpureus]
MSIRYQCLEMGLGSTIGHQNTSDGSTLRRHSNTSHETSFSNFQMYVQPQSDMKGQFLATHLKDVSAVVTARLSSSPIPAASSPNALNFASEVCTDASPKQPATSWSNGTISSVTTEDGEKVSSGSDGSMTMVGGACEAHSRRFQGFPGTIVGGGLSKSLADRALRVKVSSGKPGVVEHIVSLNGGYVYGSPNQNALAEHSSESSSSICQASEDSGSCSSDTGGEEAQSAYRGPLSKGSLSALEESLPIKRHGLSKFFGGKSRSFSSLAEVSSVTELAKPNNPYAKRQKMGFNCPLRDKNRSYPPPTRSSGSSIAKKLPSSGSRNTLAVAVILGGLKDEHNEQLRDVPNSVRNFENRSFASRSYSLTDLPHAANPPPPRRAFAGP